MAPRLCALPFSCSVGLLAITIHLSPVEGAYGPTCNGFDELITNVNHMVCTRNEACDTARCNVTQSGYDQYAITLTLLSCREPRPGMLVIVRDRNSGEEVLNTVVDESRSGIPLSSSASLDITLDQLEDAIGIAASVTVTIATFTITLDLLSYTILPLDRQSCLIQNTGANTCAVLAKLAADAEFFNCTSDTTKPCDTVFCTKNNFLGKNYSAVVVLLPCVTPTAVRLSMSDGEKVLVNKTVDHSQEITVPELVLVITLDHFDEAIGLKVDAELGGTHNLLEFTVIPLDRSSCGSKSSSLSVAKIMPIFYLLPAIAYITTATVMT